MQFTPTKTPTSSPINSLSPVDKELVFLKAMRDAFEDSEDLQDSKKEHLKAKNELEEFAHNLRNQNAKLENGKI